MAEDRGIEPLGPLARNVCFRGRWAYSIAQALRIVWPLTTRSRLNVFPVRAVTANVAATIPASQQILSGEDLLAVFDVAVTRLQQLKSFHFIQSWRRVPESNRLRLSPVRFSKPLHYRPAHPPNYCGCFFMQRSSSSLNSRSYLHSGQILSLPIGSKGSPQSLQIRSFISQPLVGSLGLEPRTKEL